MIAKPIGEPLDLIQPPDRDGRFPARPSGGQRQRVALARTSAIDPQPLLPDEPFGTFDARMGRDRRGIHDETGLATIFVTHDRQEAPEPGRHLGCNPVAPGHDIRAGCIGGSDRWRVRFGDVTPGIAPGGTGPAKLHLCPPAMTAVAAVTPGALPVTIGSVRRHDHVRYATGAVAAARHAILAGVRARRGGGESHRPADRRPCGVGGAG